MRFKFCGNHECPEWIVSEIVALAKITSVRLRLLAGYIIAKIKGLAYEVAKMEKICMDSGLSEAETKSVLVVLEFIIRGAAKFQVEDADLLKEVEQLGLPHENTDSLIKAINKDKEGLVTAVKNSVLRLSRPTGLDYQISFVAATDRLHGKAVVDTIVGLKVTYADHVTHASRDAVFSMAKEQLAGLITELKRCEEVMAKIEL